MFIRQNPGKSGIIYCLSRKKVEELAEILKANEIKAAPYHAGLDSATRSQTQDDFLMERIDVIVATIAFGMGIDKPDVRFDETTEGLEYGELFMRFRKRDGFLVTRPKKNMVLLKTATE